MLKHSLILFFFVASVCTWATKPMESIENYNVILVHGVADGVINGFECYDEDVKKEPCHNTCSLFPPPNPNF